MVFKSSTKTVKADNFSELFLILVVSKKLSKTLQIYFMIPRVEILSICKIMEN